MANETDNQPVEPAEEPENEPAEQTPEEPPQEESTDTVAEPEVEPDETKEERGEENQEDKSPSNSRLHRFKNWYLTNKKLSIPSTLLITLIILAAIPWTRYHAAALVVKKDLKLHVVDATAHTPVSNAQVNVAGLSGVTDSSGLVTIQKVKAGPHKVYITKKYYQSETLDIAVPIFGSSNSHHVNFTATGRQVKIVISNLITGKKLKDVSIKLADTEAKTDSQGSALIVVPTGTDTQQATLTVAGYNDRFVTIETSGSSVKVNKFDMTPSGSIYFLSKRTGKLNVMKVNLDGSGAKVVIEGTGNEQTSNTILMPSSDGKNVALLAQRNDKDKVPQLYVFSTSDEKLFQADTGNADFNLIGWSGSHLIYSLTRNDLQSYQLGKQKIKSYDADSGKITLLDQSESSDPDLGLSQLYDMINLSGESVVFAKYWSSDSGDAVADKSSSLNVVDVDGQNYKTVASYDTPNFIQYDQYSPVSFYIWQQSQDDASKDVMYDYTIGSTPQKITASRNIIDLFNNDASTYFFSPSGNKTMWTEDRDGKNAFIVGDSSGGNSNVVTSLGEFNAEGWYSDDYLLVSKKGSELYIMSAAGSNPIKLTDYQSTYNYY